MVHARAAGVLVRRAAHAARELQRRIIFATTSAIQINKIITLDECSLTLFTLSEVGTS